MNSIEKAQQRLRNIYAQFDPDAIEAERQKLDMRMIRCNPEHTRHIISDSSLLIANGFDGTVLDPTIYQSKSGITPAKTMKAIEKFADIDMGSKIILAPCYQSALRKILKRSDELGHEASLKANVESNIISKTIDILCNALDKASSAQELIAIETAFSALFSEQIIQDSGNDASIIKLCTAIQSCGVRINNDACYRHDNVNSMWHIAQGYSFAAFGLYSNPYIKDVYRNKTLLAMLVAKNHFSGQKNFVLDNRSDQTPDFDNALNHYLTPQYINSADINGETALHYACIVGNEEVIIKLVQHGANPDIKNKKGLKPIDMLKETQEQRIDRLLEIIERDHKTDDIRKMSYATKCSTLSYLATKPNNGYRALTQSEIDLIHNKMQGAYEQYLDNPKEAVAEFDDYDEPSMDVDSTTTATDKKAKTVREMLEEISASGSNQEAKPATSAAQTKKKPLDGSYSQVIAQIKTLLKGLNNIVTIRPNPELMHHYGCVLEYSALAAAIIWIIAAQEKVITKKLSQVAQPYSDAKADIKTSDVFNHVPDIEHFSRKFAEYVNQENSYVETRTLDKEIKELQKNC